MAIVLADIKEGESFLVGGIEFILVSHDTSTEDLSLCKIKGKEAHVFIAKTSGVNDDIERLNSLIETRKLESEIFERQYERKNMLFIINNYKRWNLASMLAGVLCLFQIGLFFLSTGSNIVLVTIFVNFVMVLLSIFGGWWFGSKIKFDDNGKFDKKV